MNSRYKTQLKLRPHIIKLGDGIHVVMSINSGNHFTRGGTFFNAGEPN